MTFYFWKLPASIVAVVLLVGIALWADHELGTIALFALSTAFGFAVARFWKITLSFNPQSRELVIRQWNPFRRCTEKISIPEGAIARGDREKFEGIEGWDEHRQVKLYAPSGELIHRIEHIPTESKTLLGFLMIARGIHDPEGFAERINAVIKTR